MVVLTRWLHYRGGRKAGFHCIILHIRSSYALFYAKSCCFGHLCHARSRHFRNFCHAKSRYFWHLCHAMSRYFSAILSVFNFINVINSL